jgi:hypothetical protein
MSINTSMFSPYLKNKSLHCEQSILNKMGMNTGKTTPVTHLIIIARLSFYLSNLYTDDTNPFKHVTDV